MMSETHDPHGNAFDDFDPKMLNEPCLETREAFTLAIESLPSAQLVGNYTSAVAEYFSDDDNAVQARVHRIKHHHSGRDETTYTDDVYLTAVEAGEVCRVSSTYDELKSTEDSDHTVYREEVGAKARRILENNGEPLAEWIDRVVAAMYEPDVFRQRELELLTETCPGPVERYEKHFSNSSFWNGANITTEITKISAKQDQIALNIDQIGISLTTAEGDIYTYSRQPDGTETMDHQVKWEESLPTIPVGDTDFHAHEAYVAELSDYVLARQDEQNQGVHDVTEYKMNIMLQLIQAALQSGHMTLE